MMSVFELPQPQIDETMSGDAKAELSLTRTCKKPDEETDDGQNKDQHDPKNLGSSRGFAFSGL